MTMIKIKFNILVVSQCYKNYSYRKNIVIKDTLKNKDDMTGFYICLTYKKDFNDNCFF